jgi:hypothetical protein
MSSIPRPCKSPRPLIRMAGSAPSQSGHDCPVLPRGAAEPINRFSFTSGLHARRARAASTRLPCSSRRGGAACPAPPHALFAILRPSAARSPLSLLAPPLAPTLSHFPTLIVRLYSLHISPILLYPNRPSSLLTPRISSFSPMLLYSRPPLPASPQCLILVENHAMPSAVPSPAGQAGNRPRRYTARWPRFRTRL